MSRKPGVRSSRVLRAGLKVLVAAAGLGLVFRAAPPQEVWSRLAEVRPGPVALSLFLLTARVPLGVLRWSALLRSAGVRIPFAFLHRACWVGLFFNTFLPGAVGGDLARVVLLGREGPGYSAAAGSVLAERLLGLAALAAMLPAAAPFLPREFAGLPVVRTLLALAAALVAGAGLGLWVLGRGLARLRLPDRGALGAAAGWLRGMAGFGGSPGALAAGLALSAVFQALGVGAAVCLFAGVGAEAPAPVLLFALPAAFLAAAVPLSINGLGIREGVLVYLLALAGLAPGATLSASVLWLALTSALGLAGGAVFLLRPGRNLPARAGGIHLPPEY